MTEQEKEYCRKEREKVRLKLLRIISQDQEKVEWFVRKAADNAAKIRSLEFERSRLEKKYKRVKRVWRWLRDRGENGKGSSNISG